jgi:hypothetical protein
VIPRSGSTGVVSPISKKVHNTVRETHTRINPNNITDIGRYWNFLVGEYDNDRRTATGGVRGVLVTKSEGDNRCVTGVLPTLLGLIEDTGVDDGGVRGCKEPFLTRGFSTRGIKPLVLMLYNAEAPRICEGMKRLEKPG